MRVHSLIEFGTLYIRADLHIVVVHIDVRCNRLSPDLNCMGWDGINSQGKKKSKGT